jgi:hypothetical protein
MEKYLVNADGSLTKYSDVKQPVEKKTVDNTKQLIKKDVKRIKMSAPPGFRIRWSKLSS